MKKRIKFITILLSIFLSLNFISAIDLDVSVKTVQNAVITDTQEPAKFELTIKNLNETDDFEIYSLVGIDITPKEFTIEEGKTKILNIEVMPRNPDNLKQGLLSFQYKIKDSESNIQEEKLTINLIKLNEAFSITPDLINPKSEYLEIEIKNKLNRNFEDIILNFQSTFFDYKETISLSPNEEKKLQIPIDIEKLKGTIAGNYLLNTNIEVEEEKTEIESIIKFLEQEGIETTENKEGIFVKRQEVNKNNVGNTIKSVEVVVQKDMFSYLFTTFNIVPTETDREGFNINYIWKKELIPNEELNIIVKTNWFFPIIVILFIIILIILIKKSIERDLELRKKVSFVKTRGGEFALKVTIKLRAKKFIERINIIDKLPPLVVLYERYGTITPDKVDLKNRRLEWNIPSLNEKEERIFSYIIYSKIGVVGKFELPRARAVYEKEGKINETETNRSFFINQPKK